MGGYLVNGCGVEDSFYHKKELGTYYCPHCKQLGTFTLDEVKRKIRIFFIPTITCTTRYAVVCQKCETGYYVEEEDRIAIQNGDACIETTENGIRIWGRITPVIPPAAIADESNPHSAAS